MFPQPGYHKTGDTWLGPAELDYSGPVWCQVLNKLADEATSLASVYVYFDAEGWMHAGAGKDLNFVRALGRMKVSKSMKIEGNFAKRWPQYLEEKLGMPVWDPQEQREWERLYQRGTEKLIP